ncbi:hypothetical protein [Litorimonas sp.]|uniref:hypothetical protein n=1 Tax=Litorimonas sp. TaxID=1892381 RepID=UPI003A84DCE3
MWKYLIGLASILMLQACQTTANPDPYMEFDCAQLRALSDSERPVDPFLSHQVGPDPQSGLIGDRQGLQTERDVAVSDRDDEARAIRAAYRTKNCH